MNQAEIIERKEEEMGRKRIRRRKGRKWRRKEEKRK